MTPHDVPNPQALSAEARAELLTAYIDGQLEPAAAQAVAVWLEAHPAMLREVETLRRIDDLLGTYPDPDVPAGFADRVLAATSSATPLVAHAGGLRRWLPMAAAALVLAGVGGLIGFGWGRGRVTPQGRSPTLAVLDAVPAAALEDDALLDFLVVADQESFDAWLEGEFDELVSDAG
ncbi:MAG: anti-sigma factor [Planctomycetota bacterium]